MNLKNVIINSRQKYLPKSIYGLKKNWIYVYFSKFAVYIHLKYIFLKTYSTLAFIIYTI